MLRVSLARDHSLRRRLKAEMGASEGGSKLVEEPSRWSLVRLLERLWELGVVGRSQQLCLPRLCRSAGV